MIRADFTGMEALTAALQAWSPRIQTEMEVSIGRLTLILQREVMANRLSGQVLNVQTGNLRRSIHQKVKSSGNQVSGTVNTNVRYGVMHEYGFAGTVSVKAHLRQVRQVFGHTPASPRTARVGAHSRRVNYPERSFLRTALRDLRPAIEQELGRAVERARQ